MTKFYSQAILAKERKPITVAPDFDLRKHIRESHVNGQRVYEFIGAGDFDSEWYERQRYQVDTGRDRVPTLYEPIYDITVDATLPETLTLKNFGPGGFVFEEVFEGGEVKFAHITSSEAAVSQRQFGVGLEYTKKLMMFNQLWAINRLEQNVGEAHNALLNHLHFNPILTATYGAGNQTAFNSTGATAVEDVMLTIEDAIANSRADTTNPRRGPYVLLINSAKEIIVEKALRTEVQSGLASQSRVLDSIRAVISYDGWSGTRGAKTTTYTGVNSAKGYLVSLQYQSDDFVSLVKQPLDSVMGNPDVSRFIMEQVVWDVWLGVYANPVRAVEEISWS
jgi:hypothetical protein